MSVSSLNYRKKFESALLDKKINFQLGKTLFAYGINYNDIFIKASKIE